MSEETIGRTTVLIPQGVLDLTTLPAFDARVSRLIKAGTINLVWDLGSLEFLPSTAAGFLLQTSRRLREVGGRCALAGGSSRVIATLRTMGILELFPSYPDRATALARFETRARSSPPVPPA